MSSSTSSSRRGLAVAAIVIAFFVAFEVMTRQVFFVASKDLRRFSTYPARARALMAGPGPHVAVFGNSMTERGIDTALFARTLGVSAESFTADSAHLNAWIWMANQQLWRQGLAPELIVLNFNRRSLADGQNLEIGRLAQFFTRPADWPELFEHELVTLERRAEHVVASGWATFAVRDRLKERVLGLVPGYKPYLTEQNAIIAADDRVRAARRSEAPATFSTLRRFLARARQHGSHVLVVAYPSRVGEGDKQYEVAPAALAEIEAAGMTFLDLREVPGLDPTRHYDDDVHLNAEGRRLYTLHLAGELARLGLLRP
jgi:hypothetical protein